MADLPGPKVEVVDTSDGKQHVNVSHGGPGFGAPRSKSYEVRGTTEKEKIQHIAEDLLSNPPPDEWLKKR